jgi:hypothetical protein
MDEGIPFYAVGGLIFFVSLLIGSSVIGTNPDGSPKGCGLAVAWFLAGLVVGATVVFAGCAYALRGL